MDIILGWFMSNKLFTLLFLSPMEPAIADFANDVWRRAKGISLEEDNSATKFSGENWSEIFI